MSLFDSLHKKGGQIALLFSYFFAIHDQRFVRIKNKIEINIGNGNLLNDI